MVGEILQQAPTLMVSALPAIAISAAASSGLTAAAEFGLRAAKTATRLYRSEASVRRANKEKLDAVGEGAGSMSPEAVNFGVETALHEVGYHDVTRVVLAREKMQEW